MLYNFKGEVIMLNFKHTETLKSIASNNKSKRTNVKSNVAIKPGRPNRCGKDTTDKINKLYNNFRQRA
jgi:hypothetical protein